jgi:hypothetical protein
MGDNIGQLLGTADYWKRRGIGMYGTMNVEVTATVFNQAQMKSGHDLYLVETYG